MATYEALVDKIKALSTLLSRKDKPKLTKTELERALSQATVLYDDLAKKFPLTTKEKKKAKSHPIAAQIVQFTTINADRKKFFNVNYWKKKFNSLAEDKSRVTSTNPGTLAAARDAVIYYYYWFHSSKPEQGLKTLQTESEEDLLNDPEAQKVEDLRSFHQNLMGEDDLESVVQMLSQEFPNSEELKAFAKAVKVKIPAQKRGKDVQKKSLHERLAEKIHSMGAISRMELK